MHRPSFPYAVALLITAFTLLRLLLAAVAPLTPQEAYYWTWSRLPDWLYFDHPPLASYLIGATTALLADRLRRQGGAGWPSGRFWH